MYNVSNDFKTYIKKSDRTFDAKLLVNGVSYSSSDIIQFNIDEALTSDDTLKIGEVIASQMDITLKSTVSIPVNSKLEPFIRILCGAIYSEWVPCGTFYVDTRSINRDITSFVCYNDLIKSNQPYSTSLLFPETMLNVMNDIAYILGLTLDASVVIDPSYMVPFHDEDMTIHDVLSYIASAHCASIYLTKDNKLAFKKFNTPVSLDTIATTEYFKLLPKNETKSYTKIKCYNDMDGGFITSGTGDDDHTMEIDNIFMTQGMLDACVTVLSGFSYIPFNMEWRGRAYVDLGDCYTIQTKDGTIVSTILNNKISYKNGLYGVSYANSQTKQKSEFNYSGSLRKSIAKAGALIGGRPYYGVTFSKNYGIKIETSDGSSEAIFNSDQLVFRGKNIDGTMGDRIYFDTILKRYVFDGVLSADTIESLTFNAETGYIAELTVDSVDTSIKIKRYKESNTDPMGYWRGYLDRIEFTYATVTDPVGEEQARNRSGQLLYWTTSQETAITVEETDYPVMQYTYDEIPSLIIRHNTDPDTGFNFPRISFGAGFGMIDPDRGKGFLYKDSDEFVFEFKQADGTLVGIRIGSDGSWVKNNTGEIGLRNIHISSTQPTTPQMNDLWIDTGGV